MQGFIRHFRHYGIGYTFVEAPPKVELGIFLVSFFETSIPILWHHMLADVVTIVGTKDILGD
jgi:hypothetical protein